MNSLYTLMMLGLAAGLLLACAGAVALSAWKLYHVPDADEALVRTGGKRPVVSTGGLWVVPIFHRLSRMSLKAIRIPIDRRGAEALPTADKLMAEIVGELIVQVNPHSEADIVQAVQALGVTRPDAMAAQVTAQIDSLVTDALRTAAFKKTFHELNSEKKSFADEVIQLLGEDLAKLGLTLTAVTIPHIYQGRFTQDAGDVFAAEGMRNVAGIVEDNRKQTNRIRREAEIAIQKQDVEARELALELELRQKQREADQSRQVEEYEAQQRAETRQFVLLQDQTTEQALANQEREVETARISQTRQVEEAQIAKREAIAVRTALAVAAKKVAEEEAQQKQETAEIARQQAIAEAEIAKQVAIAARRKQEAEARALQAAAEAEQKAAEENVETVAAEAEAERRRRVVVIAAQEQADRERIVADKDAYVDTRQAEADRDVATRRAEGLAATATGELDAARLRAEAYATDKKIRAEAEVEASEKEASARRALAEALLAEGRAKAEAERLIVEARNAISRELLVRDVAIEAIRVAPDAIRELMAPVAKVAHDVKILQVNGLGDGNAEGLPATILNTGLAAAGIAPFLKSAVQGLRADPEVRRLEGALGEVAREAVKETVKALSEGPEAPVDKAAK